MQAMMRIGHEGLRPYIEALWGWDDAAQKEQFSEHFVIADVSIIQCEGQDAGYLKVEEAQGHIYLAGIYLSSTHRRRGIGTEVITDLITRSRGAGKPLRLRVLRPNPSQHLYARLGFKVVDTTDTHIFMELNTRGS